VETLIVDAVIEANERQRDAMIPKIEKLVGDLHGKQIGVLGLSFKPETDDMRESPAIDIIKEMLNRGAKVKLLTR
jgi:UDPglucose 6-dehydrogenase